MRLRIHIGQSQTLLDLTWLVEVAVLIYNPSINYPSTITQGALPSINTMIVDSPYVADERN